MKFTDFDLPAILLDNLTKNNFTEPTEIQQKALPVLMTGKDLIACSQTGTGKTIAFLIPMLKRLYEEPNSEALILTPTRELAMQITDNLKKIVPKTKGSLGICQLIGGQDIRKQFKSLQQKPRVIVATPGRLIDHHTRNTVHLHKKNLLVLDEGDRMIDMGFAPQLEKIVKFLPEERQTSFFTATLDKKVQQLASQYLQSPAKIEINNAVPVSKIKQTVVQVNSKDKEECVLNEVTARKGSIIVFVKTKYGTDNLKKYLNSYGVDAESIHGGKTQGQRNRVIKEFKAQEKRILCATDVAARGLDVPHIEHVINFDIPMQDEDYVHRIGRTARNGSSGEAITFVTPNEERSWNRIAKKYEIQDCFIEIEKAARKSFSEKSEGGRKPRSKKKPFGKKGGFKSGFKKKADSEFETGKPKVKFGSRPGSAKSTDQGSEDRSNSSYGERSGERKRSFSKKKKAGSGFSSKRADSGFGNKKSGFKKTKKRFGRSRPQA